MARAWLLKLGLTASPQTAKHSGQGPLRERDAGAAWDSLVRRGAAWRGVRKVQEGPPQAVGVALGRILAIASLAFGVLFYVLGVAGVFWPASPATDVGLLSTSAIFVLMGGLGLLLKPQPAA